MPLGSFVTRVINKPQTVFKNYFYGVESLEGVPWWEEFKELTEGGLSKSVLINRAMDKVAEVNWLRELFEQSSMEMKWRILEILAARIRWRDDLGRE